MKDTAYGLIKDDWKIETLTDVCVSGGIQTGPFGSQLHQKDYLPVGTPIITVEHLGENRILHQDLPRISNADRDRLSRYIMRKGDIIFSRVGSVDRRALVRDKEDGWLFSGRCLRVRPNNSKIDPDFLSWFFGLEIFKDYIRRIAVGATMPSLNTELLSNVPVIVPPLPEQRAIAGILGALDDKIEVNRRMNATLESMARAVFRQWFVEGEQVNGWEEKSLDEIANFLNGLALQKFPPESNEYLPVIKIAQLRKNDTEGADKANTNIPPEYVIEDGDILFSWSGSLEVVIWCGGKGALNQHLFKVTSEQYPKWFYYFWTKHHLPDFQEIAAGKATTMGHIQRHHLKAAKVFVPSDKELREMDKVMSPLLDKMVNNNLESRTLASLRDGLLPRLISGEVRVGELEKEL